MMTSRPDFEGVHLKATEFLITLNSINSFPYSAKKVVDEISGIKCIPFSYAMQSGVDISLLGSDSGMLVEQFGRNIVFYNQTKPDTHIKYTLLHEIGHLVNCHDSELDSTCEPYGIQEVETNFFAAQLLMPVQLIEEFMRRGKQISVEFLVKTFGVSFEAANKRLDTLRKFPPSERGIKQRELDDIVIFKFLDFINKTAPKGKEIDWFEEDFENEESRRGW